MRILYVHSTVQPPPTDLTTDRFNLLSSRIEGDVLQPIWFETPEEVEALFGPGSYPVYTVGRFRYHWFLGSAARGMRQKLASFWFYIRKGTQLYREQKYDCIVAYSHMTTGVLAAVLKILTGAKLIIEIVTSPDLVYITHRPDPTLGERVMKVYSDACLHFCMFIADRAHFLYPGQLQPFPLLRKTANSVFHEFVPVAIIEPEENRELKEQYILLAGAPWYLKGADVLIKAFLKVAPDFPAVKLKILGHYHDRTKLDELSGNSPQVEVLQARPHTEAIQVIKAATIMVMPSRCEGLSRALLEGMAAALPVVGSDVGGIPQLIRHGVNGFLVPVGDHEALAGRLRELLSDSELRRRMGRQGYDRAHGELNEEAYVKEFAGMIEVTVAGGVN